MNTYSTISRRQFLVSTMGAVSCGGWAAAGFASDQAGNDKKTPLIDCHFHINHKARSVEDSI